MTRKKALSQARTRRRLYPTAVRMTLATALVGVADVAEADAVFFAAERIANRFGAIATFRMTCLASVQRLAISPK